MTAGISPVAGVGDIGALHGTAGPEATHDADAKTFFDMFDEGIGRLAQRPDLNEDVTDMDKLTSDYAGDVGKAKVDILGGAEVRADQAEGAQQASLEQRLTSLYFELTHYQVAWRIVQNVQRDVSQVLRGS